MTDEAFPFDAILLLSLEYSSQCTNITHGAQALLANDNKGMIFRRHQTEVASSFANNINGLIRSHHETIFVYDKTLVIVLLFPRLDDSTTRQE
jgi:hypothetical protein